jgi:hypothetical protein
LCSLSWHSLEFHFDIGCICLQGRGNHVIVGDYMSLQHRY